jgi:hypothetical protein
MEKAEGDKLTILLALIDTDMALPSLFHLDFLPDMSKKAPLSEAEKLAAPICHPRRNHH